LTQEQLRDEGHYRASAAVLKFMSDQGWLSEKEHQVALRKLLRAYRPAVGSLWCK